MSTLGNRSRTYDVHPPSAPDARTLTLSEAMREASARGVSCTVASTEYTMATRVDVRFHTASRPAQVVMRLGNNSDVGSRSVREVDDGVFECEVAAPQQQIEFVLLLESAEQSVSIPLVAGDCAALATLGWADASIGARCEVRVSRATLDRALGAFSMEQATPEARDA